VNYLFSACVLIRTIHGKYEDVVKAISQIEGVKKIFPVLGRYDVVVDLEVSDYEELGSTIMRMGRVFGVVFTESLLEMQY